MSRDVGRRGAHHADLHADRRVPAVPGADTGGKVSSSFVPDADFWYEPLIFPDAPQMQWTRRDP